MASFKHLLAMTLSISVISVSGQINTPCTTSMIASFIPCLNFITGSSPNGGSPTVGCCNAVESLMTTSMECSCLIVTASGLPLPPMAGPALFVPPPPKLPPPRALPPPAYSPELPPSPSGSETAELAPTPSEMTQDEMPKPEACKEPDASAPTAQRVPTRGSGIRQVITSASPSNPLKISTPLLLIMLTATTKQKLDDLAVKVSIKS